MFGLPCCVSSVSHMLQQADHIDGDMHFANGPIICTLGTVQNLSVRNRKRKMKRTRRRGQLSDRNEGLIFCLHRACKIISFDISKHFIHIRLHKVSPVRSSCQHKEEYQMILAEVNRQKG